MNVLYSIKLLLLWTLILVDGVPVVDITYEELEKLGASCNTLDNCKFQRDKDVLEFYTCHCNSFCSQLGTCCIDSPYRRKENRKFQMPCKNAYGMYNSHYFIEDKCLSSSNNDGIWENLCRNSNDEDLLSLVPVTSFSTNMTYKNYFCFRCNESGNKYNYWNIKIFSNIKSGKKEQNNVTLTYNSINQTWVAPIGKDGSIIPVTFSVEVPYDIQHLPKQCVPNVISSCSEDWKDSVIHQKCNAYTSIIYFIRNEQTISYRNPHCALCNFENLENMLCALKITGRTTSKRPFSFTYLLDINRSEGELVGKIQKCGDNSVWDPFYNKCRILTCAIPDYVVQNGKCVPP